MSTPAETERRHLLRCPACGGEEFVQIWEGYVYSRGRFVIETDAAGDCEFVEDDFEFGEGELLGFECASCEAEIDPYGPDTDSR